MAHLVHSHLIQGATMSVLDIYAVYLALTVSVFDEFSVYLALQEVVVF